MKEIDQIGSGWLQDRVEGMTDQLHRVTPVEFNEQNRYLPESVTSLPGYIRYSVNPYMREIVNCFDVNSPVREVNLMKGVQITYTTVLESGMFYFMAHVKTRPLMYLTADKDLASARIENNVLPMLQQSGFADIVRSSDEGNTRKTGKTSKHIQHEGGGYVLPYGAQNADKMRAVSIAVMLKDELDAFPHFVGKDGCPDLLSDSRCDGYSETKKIFRGSTPLEKETSKIYARFLEGDQRQYKVRCFNPECRHPQPLRWHTEDKDTGIIGGFKWDFDADGRLDTENVRWCCAKCGHAHYERDKERLFSEEDGAEWVPTAKSKVPNVRSYHLSALYSPPGFKPWWECVALYLKAYDPEARKVRNAKTLQVFYNNILGWPFQTTGSKVTFSLASAHRRTCYRRGEIPNEWAATHAGGRVSLLTCQVDIHEKWMAVGVTGWVRGAKTFLVDYWRWDVETGDVFCTDINCRLWGKLRRLIEEKRYTADDGRTYGLAVTFVDSGYAPDTVVAFCSDYSSGVYPIVGRDRPAKVQRIAEFAEFQTPAGTKGFRLLVDSYKDRLAPVLRREWIEESGQQQQYHFNAPIDVTDSEMRELTKESRRPKRNAETGEVSYYWYRPPGAPNELWDLLVYGHGALEVLAWDLMVTQLEEETVDWNRFWDYVEEKSLYYVPADGKV